MTGVHRLLAPNPGPMTGPGTNTYLIVSGRDCVVLDPGPAEESHRRAIVGAIGQLRLRAVVVTHTHPDHAPLAGPLAAEFGVHTYGYAPGPGFSPSRRLRDGDRLRFGEAVLAAVHTPGHTADHLCFRMGSTVFTGDHIIGGSTVLVQDMGDYFRSLDRIRALRPQRLLPGHGSRIDDAAEVIAAYIAHRREREAQILRAVRDGARTVGAVVQAVYGEVDPRLRAAAEGSALAHLRHLARRGTISLGHGDDPGDIVAARDAVIS